MAYRSELLKHLYHEAEEQASQRFQVAWFEKLLDAEARLLLLELKGFFHLILDELNLLIIFGGFHEPCEDCDGLGFAIM